MFKIFSIFFTVVTVFLTSNLFAQEQELQPGDKIVVLYGADWCHFCKIIKSTIDKSSDIQEILSNQYNNRFWYILDERRNENPDVEWWFDFLQKETNSVISYPTTAIFVFNEDTTWTLLSFIKGNKSEEDVIQFLIQ